jgi:hypothetical protein
MKPMHPPTGRMLSHADAECRPQSGHLSLDDLQAGLITELLLALPPP